MPACPNCKKEQLKRVPPDSEDEGYICPRANKFEKGEGCHVVVSSEEYDELKSEEKNKDEDYDDNDQKESKLTIMSQEKEKEKTVKSLVSGNLVVQRAAPIASITVKGDEKIKGYHRSFKPPRQDASCIWTPGVPRTARGHLGVRKRFFGGTFGGLKVTEQPPPPPRVEEPVEVPADFEPLILWEPTAQELAENPNLTKIEVPTFLTKVLRPHQREGVQFMAECVLGQRDFDGTGVILADDMGLGKTLQSVTLLYSLIIGGFEKLKPIAKRVVIICPTSLVANWENEIKKWVGDRVKCVALSDPSKDKVLTGIRIFLTPNAVEKVLIISYETFRKYANKFNGPDSCDLLICDEAHRLKNDQTQTYQTLCQLECKRRVVLTGTPMQNDLGEFYAMVNFSNPGVLGAIVAFRKQYERPILHGREPYATEKEVELGIQRAEELSKLVNQFVLRRTNVLLSKHLPPKVVEVVICGLSPLQQAIYAHMLKSKAVKTLLDNGKKTLQVLPLITALRSLCNHPKIVWDIRHTSKAGFTEGIEGVFPQGYIQNPSHPDYSGKMGVLDRLLQTVKKTSDDRVVLISNFTQTLDMFVTMCKMRNWGYLRLDGNTSVKKRQKLVDQLTDKSNPVFIFLLSSKAGGCGLNLIGANRLVLFDPDWNPAIDKQAAARVWRDGQTKRCYIYRFLAGGSIEEKIYQRQLSKEGLQDVLGGAVDTQNVSTEDLRDLFNFQDTKSDTHDSLECECCKSLEEKKEKEKQQSKTGFKAPRALNDKGPVAQRLQKGRPEQEDLLNWAHHAQPLTVPDPAFRKAFPADGHNVSFVFTCEVDGRPLTGPVEDEAKSTSSIDPNFVPPPDDGKSVLSSTSLAGKTPAKKENKKLSSNSSNSSTSTDSSTPPSSSSSNGSDNGSDNDDDDDDDDDKPLSKSRNSKKKTPSKKETKKTPPKKETKSILATPSKPPKPIAPIVAIPPDPNNPIPVEASLDPSSLRRSGRSRRPPQRMHDELKKKELKDSLMDIDLVALDSTNNENQSSLANKSGKNSIENLSNSIDPASLQLIMKLQQEGSQEEPLTQEQQQASRQAKRSKLSTANRRRKAITIDDDLVPTSNPSSSSSDSGPIPSPKKKRGRPSRKNNNSDSNGSGSNGSSGMDVNIPLQLDGDLSHLTNFVPVLDTSGDTARFTFVPTPV